MKCPVLERVGEPGDFVSLGVSRHVTHYSIADFLAVLISRILTAIGEHRTIIEPFKIKTVEPLALPTMHEREEHLERVGFNLSILPSEVVTFDFLTDSGTTAMSAAQWGAMLISDESYAGSRSIARLERVVRELTGCVHVISTHQ